MTSSSVSFLPLALGLGLILGRPILTRAFLRPPRSHPGRTHRPRDALFYATAATAVLPVWALALLCWAALGEALYRRVILHDYDVWSARSRLGKAWLVWAAVEVRPFLRWETRVRCVRSNPLPTREGC